MRILLIGKNGQLGWELQRTLATLGAVFAHDAPEIDLTDPEQLNNGLEDLLENSQPQVIVNASAYTAVDRAEAEPDKALAVNALAPGRLAELAMPRRMALIHYSTDYVFDGRKGAGYVEQDAPNPLNIYGSSKLAGEQAIQKIDGAYLILRTSWVYSLRRASFVTKVMEWARRNPSLHIVADQIGNPTWARMLAEVTAQVLAASDRRSPASWINERKGIYHLAGDGCASRFEWAQAILRLDPRPEEQVTKELLAARTADFPSPAERPLYSALDCTHFKDTFGFSLPDWQTCLKMALDSDLEGKA
jgi:dTDP-4-dehydrorhamnose reductase